MDIDFENLTGYERFQLEKYGDIIPAGNTPLSVRTEEDVFREWMEGQAEQQLNDKWE